MYRYSTKLLKYFQNSLLLWQFFLISKKYLNLFNIVFLVMPLDLTNIFELFNFLVEDDSDNENKEDIIKKETKIDWDIIIFGALALLGLYFWYKSTTFGGDGVDFSSFRRITPLPPESVESPEFNPDFDPEFAALLDKVFNNLSKTEEGRDL